MSTYGYVLLTLITLAVLIIAGDLSNLTAAIRYRRQLDEQRDRELATLLSTYTDTRKGPRK